MTFLHMHGTGNQFLILDAFRETPPSAEELPALARRLCRRDGGVDGLLVVEPDADFSGRMRVYNADGSIAEMCGNGLRCVGRLLVDRGYAEGEFVVATDAGPRRVAVLASEGERSDVRVSLGRPVFEPALIPTTLTGTPPVETQLAFDEETVSVTSLSMGNPHAVLFVEDSETAPVARLGPLIERHPAFPNRTNVGFVSVASRHELRLRVWERGVGETAACGTGAAAAAVAGLLTGRTDRTVLIRLRGGDLRIDWPDDAAEVTLTGDAVTVGVVE